MPLKYFGVRFCRIMHIIRNSSLENNDEVMFSLKRLTCSTKLPPCYGFSDFQGDLSKLTQNHIIGYAFISYTRTTHQE